MVGTSAIVAFFALMLSRARRNAGTVRTIMGLCDIWTRSVWSGRRQRLTLRREWQPYQSRRVVAKRSVDVRTIVDPREQSVEVESNRKRDRVASAINH
jgi:hypothetical protein